MAIGARSTDVTDVLRSTREAEWTRRMGLDVATTPKFRRREGEFIRGDREGAHLAPWFAFAPDVILWGADHLRQQGRAGASSHGTSSRGWRRGIQFSDVELAWHSAKGPSSIGGRVIVADHSARELTACVSPPRHAETHPRDAVVPSCQCSLAPRKHHPRPVHGQRHDRHRGVRDGHEASWASRLSGAGSMRR